jgi:hypothetical protein
LGREIAPRIDVLLARRFAGAAGQGQRAVEIEWKNVNDLNPWRFGLATALGETVPAALLDDALKGSEAAYYQRAGSSSPMLSAMERARFAGRAASEGILSSTALIDLYGEVYADPAAEGAAAGTASLLREAYLASAPSDRIAAMRRLWEQGATTSPSDGFAARVLTAFAAARVPPSAAHSSDAGDLIVSMLTAGLDRDAAAWSVYVKEGSLGWALLSVAQAQRTAASRGAIDSFISNDDSAGSRKSAFLVAGLAGLDRISSGDRGALSGELGADLARETRWTRLISRAAEVDNKALVVLLAGLGMQGDSWQQMTPLHLYHITSALRRVGLEAEARMIAAEAVARG